MKGQNMTSRTMNFLCLICSQRNRNVRYLTLALVENSVDQSREFCALAVGRNVRSLTFKHSVEPGVSGRTVGDRNRTGNVRCLTSDCAAGTVRGCLAGLSKKKVSDVRYLTSVVFQKSTKRIHGRVRLERPVQEQHSFLLAGQEEGATTASCVGGKGCGFWNLRTSQSLRSAAPIRRSYRSVRRPCLARTHVFVGNRHSPNPVGAADCAAVAAATTTTTSTIASTADSGYGFPDSRPQVLQRHAAVTERHGHFSLGSLRTLHRQRRVSEVVRRCSNEC